MYETKSTSNKCKNGIRGLILTQPSPEKDMGPELQEGTADPSYPFACLSATLPTILRPHHVEFNLVLQSPSDSLHPPPIYKSPYSPHPSTPFGVQAGPLGPFHPSACLCQFTHHSATTPYGIQLRTLGMESEEPVTDIIYKDSFRP